MKSFLIKKFSPFLISLIIATNSYASGLMVTPSRVELDEKNSTKEVKLINKSKETIIYRVSLQHLRMKSNGEYVEITPEEEASAPEKFADSLLRFSPRKITLKPNE
ncbi:MAG: P pilus assembly chaperone PapD, partial [Lentimonas sp.]